MQLRFRRHDGAQVADGLILHTYVFDTGSEVSHIELARRLLRSGLADKAVLPNSGEVRLANKYRGLARNISRLREFSDFGNRDEVDRSLSSTWRESSWELRRIMAGSLLRVAWSWLTGRRPDRDERDEKDRSDWQEFRTASDQFEDEVRQASIFDQVRHEIDLDLYPMEYLSRMPFIRLDLQPVDVEINLLGRSIFDAGVQRLDITLTLHDSGVGLLTMSYSVDTPTPLKYLTAATRSDKTSVKAIRISEVVAKGYALANGRRLHDISGRWEDEVEGGERWVNLNVPDESMLVDVFHFYHAALVSNFGQPILGTWLCHTTVAIQEWACCGSRSRWKKAHDGELLQVLAGVPEIDGARVDAIGGEILRDHSISPDASFYSSGGTSMEVEWSFGRSEPWSAVGLLFRMIVIENALLRFWQLKLLDGEIAGASKKKLAEKADALQEKIIFGLSEQDRVLFNARSASDLADFIFANLGRIALRRHVVERISTLSSLGAARKARVSASRSIRLAAGALVGAVVLGLPAVSQALDILAKVPSLAVSEPTRTTVAIWVYVALVGIAGALAVVPMRVRRRDVKRRRFVRRIGYTWPFGQLDIRMARRWIDEPGDQPEASDDAASEAEGRNADRA